MSTSSGHTRAILASKVKGTKVYNRQGETVGHVEDLVLDKLSHEVLFAVIGFGGLLGVGEKYHPMPWSSLDYNEDQGGYVVGLSKDVLENAPSYDLDELTRNDGHIGQTAAEHYARIK